MSGLSISFAVSDLERLYTNNAPQLFAEREHYARRDLGAKFIESLCVDQPVTVRLRRHVNESARTRSTGVTLDLDIRPVETMRVVMRELEPRPVVAHRPLTPPPKTHGVLGRLWNGWMKHVDQCRESLGG